MIKKSIELFTNGRTIIALDDEVKIGIMHYLEDKERRFEDIVRYTHKAKSTVTQHLKKLEKDNLISSVKDPRDHRKKTYKGQAKLLMVMGEAEPKLKENVLKGISTGDGEPFVFMNTIFRSLRYTMDSLGADTTPLLYMMGEQVGNELSRKIGSENLDDLLVEVANFWEKNRLGEIEIIKKKPLTFVVKDCYACSDMPNVGKTLCAFDEGVLKSIFDNKLHTKSTVKEIECFGTGHNNCRFVVLM